MKRIFVPTRSGSEWQRLLAKPDRHWKPGRSAMTAAACWEAAYDRLPPEIERILDSSGAGELNGLKLLAAIPEWQVPLPGGSRPSFTDVLALARNDVGLCVLAIEAKAGEDFGPTVGNRRAQGSDGQESRLDSLEQLLGSRFEADVRYQLVHRAASALLTAKDFHAHAAVMLVHAWNATHDQRRDFERFCAAMRADPLGTDVWRANLETQSIFLVWCDGNPDFSAVKLPSELGINGKVGES